MPSTTQLPPIYNPFTAPGSTLNVKELTDRTRVEFYVQNMAHQMNTARRNAGSPQQGIPNSSSWVKDLNEYIADIVIETTVQGSSFLEVHIIDPFWVLLQRDANGNCFIDVDEVGFLWPPIDVNFPPKVTDCTWRLCQLRPSTDLNAPNLILTFEDVIVTQLREQSQQLVGGAQTTRAEFIRDLIQYANAHPNPTDVKIKFVPLLPTSTLTTIDLGQAQTPPSSQRNHKKSPRTVGSAIAGAAGKGVGRAIAGAGSSVGGAITAAGNAASEISIGHQSQALAAAVGATNPTVLNFQGLGQIP